MLFRRCNPCLPLGSYSLALESYSGNFFLGFGAYSSNLTWVFLHFPTLLCININCFSSSGVLKPRQMCLVLGCPGSGCTTFLKAISNQREEYAAIAGEVLYAGMSAEEMGKYYQGEVVYNQEGQGSR